MSAAGDLRTVLTLDDYEFVTGLREAAQETKTFAATAQQGMGKAGAGGAAFGRSVSQMGFALQDFSSILSMGGKNAMGRALMSTMNNVQMLGAAFGPWGMAVTAVGGAIGSMLIPKLFEGKGAFDEISESTAEHTKRLEAYIQRTQEAISFQEKLNDVQSGKQLGGMTNDIAVRKQQAQVAADAYAAELKSIHDKIHQAQKMANESGGADFSNGVGVGNIFDAVLSPAKTYARSEIQSQIAELEKQKKELIDKTIKAQEDLAKFKAEEQAIDEKRPEIDFIDEQVEKEKEVNHVLQKREALLDQLRKKAETPAEKLTEQLRDLRDLFRESNGDMSVDEFDKISESYFKDFQHSLSKGPHEGKNAGAMAGTAEAYSAIRESIKAQESGNEHQEEMEVMRLQLEELRRIVRSLGTDSPDESINGVHTGPGWEGGGF